MTVLAVDTQLLLQVVWVSAVAGVSVSALFSLVILCGARATEARRAGRRRASTVFALLALLLLLIFVAGLVLGVRVMLTKD